MVAHRQSLYSLKALIDKVSYPGFEMEFSCSNPKQPQVRVTCPDGTCNHTGNPLPWNGRWWRLSPHMTDSEVVATAFKAVITCLEHEARERFLFEGVPVYNSHADVYELKRLQEEGKTDTRKDPEAWQT